MEPLNRAVQGREQLKEWKAKRDRLFDKYLKDPSNTSLALEIKAIDDLVAKSLASESEQRPKGSRNPSKKTS